MHKDKRDILIPDDASDVETLLHYLDDCGFSNSMAFNKQGIIGRLDISDNPQWNDDGALELKITVTENDMDVQKNAWCWIVELEDGRHFAWYALSSNYATAKSWT